VYLYPPVLSDELLRNDHSSFVRLFIKNKTDVRAHNIIAQFTKLLVHHWD